MSVYIVTTPKNQLVCRGDFLLKIELHKSPDLSNKIKSSIRQLKVGEAIKFPNGLKVKLLSDDMIVNLVAYLKRRKDRPTNANHSTTNLWGVGSRFK